MHIREDLCHTVPTGLELIGNELKCGLICNQIGRAYRETGVEVILRHNGLNVINKLTASLRTEVRIDNMEQTADGTLLQDIALVQLSILQCDLSLVVHHRERGRDELSTGPRAILAREGKLDPCQDVHGDRLRDLDVWLADAVGTRHRILKQLDDRTVGTGADDVAQNTCNVAKLCS